MVIVLSTVLEYFAECSPFFDASEKLDGYFIAFPGGRRICQACSVL